MGEHRLQHGWKWVVSALCALTACGAWAGNGNFERTVGSESAHMSAAHIDLSQLERSGSVRAKRAISCELCDPVGAIPVREDRRLDQRLRSQYRQIGESLAARLWDDPKGRRVKFDIEGKPGIGLEIPFD